jgi:hypothetical protein
LLQQFVPGPQSIVGLHTGAPHVPLLQYGETPPHSLPHAPQFVTSLFALTHCVPQHTNPLFEQSMAQLFAPPLPPLMDPPLPPPALPAPPFALPAVPPVLIEPPVFVVPPVLVVPPAFEPSPLESPPQPPATSATPDVIMSADRSRIRPARVQRCMG